MKKLFYTLAIVLIVLCFCLGGNIENSPAQYNYRIIDNILTGEWMTGANLITPRYFGSGVGYSRNDTGWIFVMGGCMLNVPINAFEKYNFRTNTWTSLSPLPHSLGYNASAQLKDSIYNIGGFDGSGSTNYFLKYDIYTNVWTARANLPASIGGCKAVGYQDSLIYVTGGNSSSVYLYNSNTNSWRSATNLPGARYLGAFSIAGDTLVYIGGMNGTNYYGQTYVGVISQVNRSIITWTTKSQCPGITTGMANLDAQPWGTKGIILTGGETASDSWSNICYVYSPGSDTWTQQPNKPSVWSRGQSGTIHYSAGIYKLGCASGYGSDNTIPYIQTYTDTIFGDVYPVSIDIQSRPPGNIIPKATFHNNSNTSWSFPVVLTISGLYISTKTITNLGPGSSQQVSFDTWTPSAGTYTTKVYTSLSGDINHSNDTLYKPISITNNIWTYGNKNSLKIKFGTGVGYSRNDTGWIYSIGGFNSITTNIVTKFNVKTNTLAFVSSLPNALDYTSAAVIKDTIFVIGGNDGSTDINAIYKYDIKANVWTIKAILPISIRGCKAVGYRDSLIYVAGGISGSTYLNNVYTYNVYNNNWSSATSLPFNRSYGAFSRIGDTLIYVGGEYNVNSLTNTTYKGIIQTNKQTIIWTQAADYPGGERKYFDAAQWGNLGIIVVGGYNGSNPQSDCYIYSPYANTWIPRADRNVAAYGASVGSVYLGNNIWKFISTSGSTATGVIDTTEILTESISSIGIKQISEVVPSSYSLSQNYPNPFNPETKIRFELPVGGFSSLKVYDILGREVAILVNEKLGAGTYTVDWNAGNFPSGAYFYRLRTEGYTETKRIVLLK